MGSAAQWELGSFQISTVLISLHKIDIRVLKPGNQRRAKLELIFVIAGIESALSRGSDMKQHDRELLVIQTVEFRKKSYYF